MSVFKIGDKVMISPSSIYYGRDKICNPADVVGTVIDLQSEGLALKVQWPDGSNSYNTSDLIHAPVVDADRLYTKKGREYFIGDTAFSVSQKRYQGKYSVTMKKKGSNSTSICHTEDILALASVLLDISGQRGGR